MHKNSKRPGEKSITQIQVLCIRKSDDDQDEFEDEVYDILLMHYKGKNYLHIH